MLGADHFVVHAFKRHFDFAVYSAKRRFEAGFCCLDE